VRDSVTVAKDIARLAGVESRGVVRNVIAGGSLLCDRFGCWSNNV
jgi:hypothetical protein